ncbi:hypothetical protein M406DRAFT_278760 [Cryphonectria parasitica EP155]|uniref:Rab proteins geranylgeranyltransferase n=1 Tax=Cryphonectria parasitica (strain ATCC 38755 / EP155) TaxID=660469 RepID=A0A9P4Y210_CRYP1|nr:uncharacterized protein M406DRAFT_278760 [Cryphonectria parasitica EP155]KAF3765059.1 hypothetical protein M406DRAFT_278760 [Cryphonectria parasitica EP155]
MESLSDTTWDAVICGTGLQEALLALALSRSDKKILHIDPNVYYGGAEAAFSLQEADDWASVTASAPSDSSAIFTGAAITRPPESAPAGAGAGLSNPRGYALSLSPQIIHANSELLSQLVSSRAFRQLEFLAVGSFFVLRPSSPRPILTRIPSTREDVFSSTDLSARSKRQLMKFLKLVLSYQDEPTLPQWEEYADRPLAEFLGDKMSLDQELKTYIITLTLSLDGSISTKDGLQTIHRHLTSMGKFGPGFAAVYPKWGGGSEIAQVGCRAGAVGGGVYMLGTGLKKLRSEGTGDGLTELELTDGTVVKTKLLVRGPEEASVGQSTKTSRIVAIIDSPLEALFETTMEGAPTPAVAVIAFPPGSVKTDSAAESTCPIYAIAHSSDTGECPAGQCALYLSTIHTVESKSLLENTITSLLSALAPEHGTAPHSLYQLYYEQKASTNSTIIDDGQVLDFPTTPASLSFDDGILGPVQQVWRKVLGEAAQDEDVHYMVFADREGVGDEDDYE